MTDRTRRPAAVPDPEPAQYSFAVVALVAANGSAPPYAGRATGKHPPNDSTAAGSASAWLERSWPFTATAATTRPGRKKATGRSLAGSPRSVADHLSEDGHNSGHLLLPLDR